ncbi:MFS transporter, partial [Streptomyces sp. NPDC002265]
GTFLSFRLPPKVDSAKGEDIALLASDEEHVRARWKPGLTRPTVRRVTTPRTSGTMVSRQVV